MLAAPCGEETRAPHSPSKDHWSSQMLRSTQSKKNQPNKPETKNNQLLSYAISFNITCYTEVELNYLQQVYL